MWPTNMLLQTQRLIIREFTNSDLEDFAALMANKEVMRFSISGPFNREQAQEYLQNRIITHYAQYRYGLWALILKDTQQLIGFSGLINQNIDGKKYIELGYRLFPDYWGQGFATEANQAIIRYAFETLDMNHLISIIDPQNTRSLEVAKRVGMQLMKEASFHGIPVRIFEIQRTASR